MDKKFTKYVFFDNNLEHRTLAEDISKAQKGRFSITFVGAKDSFNDSQWKAFQERVKVEVIESKTDLLNLSSKELEALFSSDKTNFFFISKNADRNVALSFLVMDVAKKLKIAYEKFAMFIAPNWEEVESFLLQRQKDIAMNFDVKLINPPRLAAYMLSKKFHPIDSLEFDSANLVAKNDIKVALVGLSVNVREALFKTYQQGRFEGAKFIVDYFDVQANAKFESFKQKFAGFLGDVEFSVKNLSTYKELEGVDFSGYDIVIIDLLDDARCVEFAKQLQQSFLTTMNIATTIAPFVECVSADEFKNCPNVQAFGNVESVFSVNAIIADAFTTSGRYVNDYYNSTKLDSNKIKNWIGLSDFERGSNVSVADFNFSFIKMIGRETFKNFKSSQDFKKWLKDNPEKYETLARTEHLRWCAYLYSNGWNVMPLEEDIMVENKDSKRKLHTCLVPFDELASVSKMFNEDYEKYDYDNVDIIFDIFKILNK